MPSGASEEERAACAAITIALSVAMSSGRESAVVGTKRKIRGKRDTLSLTRKTR